ncbi:MAG: hypothetical protein KF824_01330 [Fimbriimonadaceae bacterium]|nr:MAG: hypothetical protein KF824_01330 [Fimbriimonadaceae bacterium]
MKLKVQPPPISKVNLDTFPVVVEAAKKYAEPATKKIAFRINELENELRTEQIDREKLESLHAQLVSESQRSNDEWKNILEPKISKIKELIIHTQEQIQELEHLIGNLQSKRANLDQQLQQLVHRYYLITQVEKAEKEVGQPETIAANSLNDFLVLLKESQSALHEANQVSTAHEQAKNEIAELLES